MPKYLLEASYTGAGAQGLMKDGGSKRRAAAASLTIASSGSLRGKITVLLTPEEIDQAVKKTVSYTPPGR